MSFVSPHAIPTISELIYDDLKLMNDQRGHAEGDRLIQHAAMVLRNTLRQEDLVARLGGDEFGILTLGHDIHRVEQLK